MSEKIFSKFIKSQTTAYAVAIFFGFSVGLFVAAVFFPPRVERIEIVKPDPIQAPVPPPVIDVPVTPSVTYTPVSVNDLPGWAEDDVSSALPALKNACVSFNSKSAADSVGPDGLGGVVEDWRAPCDAIERIDSEDDEAVRATLSEFFIPYKVSSVEKPEGKFTGYYEASLRGSMTRTDIFSVPLYALPKDLIELDKRAFDLPSDLPAVIGQVESGQLVPYDARRSIEQNDGFKDRANILVWVDDPVDAHLLHIQGSGRVKMPDGTEKRIGYAGNNGRRFRGIGGILLRAGVIGRGQGSMPSVADWLRENPQEARQFMEDNPRFIFFRWIEGPGPIGALGVPLEPRRSLAVDPRYIPYGAPLWLDLNDPDGESLDGLVVALDTGSAIRGAVRGDFFWGSGEAAFYKAGRMNSPGSYYLFLPRSVSQPSQIEEKPL